MTYKNRMIIELRKSIFMVLTWLILFPVARLCGWVPQPYFFHAMVVTFITLAFIRPVFVKKSKDQRIIKSFF